MSQPLRIVVADDEPDMRDYFRKILSHLGYQVVGVAANGRELVEVCRTTTPDVVISDIKMPEMDGIEAACTIHSERPVPILLVSAYHDADLVQRATADHVMGYLVKPIKQTDLTPAISLAVQRFAQIQDLRKETGELRKAVTQSKVIEQAAAVLAKREGLQEAEGYRRLQERAAATGRKLVEMAQEILATRGQTDSTDAS